MESSSSYSSALHSLSSSDYLFLFFIRPFFAFLFVLLILSLGWLLAWKLVLVHVPLVREICGLRKKQAPPGRPKRIYTQIYNSRDAARNRVPPG